MTRKRNAAAKVPAMTTNDAICATLCAVALLLTVGCGNEALHINAEIARAMLETQVTTGPVIRELRIASAVNAAQAAHDAGGQESEAQAAAEHAASLWQCALDGHGIYSGAVSAYIDSLTLWAADSESGSTFQLSSLIPFVGRVIEAYTLLASCVTALGSDALSDAPGFLDLIPSGWNTAGSAAHAE